MSEKIQSVKSDVIMAIIHKRVTQHAPKDYTREEEPIEGKQASIDSIATSKIVPSSYQSKE